MVNLLGLLDCISVVGSDDDLTVVERLGDDLETGEVILGSFLETFDDWVLYVVLFCYTALFDDVSSPNKLGCEFHVPPPCQLHFISYSIHGSFQVILDCGNYVHFLLVVPGLHLL